METNNPFQQSNFPPNDNKAAAIVSYFWFIGWLIAYFAMYKDNQTALSRYHMRQTLLFHLVVTILSWGLGFIFTAFFMATGFYAAFYLLNLIKLALFIVWVIGLIGAINGQIKPIPFIGERAQTMFTGI